MRNQRLQTSIQIATSNAKKKRKVKYKASTYYEIRKYAHELQGMYQELMKKMLVAELTVSRSPQMTI